MTTTVPTYCRICEAACGLLVDQDDQGNPTRIRPDRAHPTSAGYACAKGTRFLEVARHPDRLATPMHRRKDGTLESVSWDAAVDGIATKLRAIREEHGPDAIGVYYGNPIAFNAVGSIALLEFLRGLGTRNVFSSITQDCGNKFAAGEIAHGSAVIHPIPDVERAELAVMFGTNPLVSQGSFVHFSGGATAFDRLIARGGEVIWIDPRRTESARRWGSHLAIRPGTDVYLILALLHQLRASAPRGDDRVHGLDSLLALAASVTPTPERAAQITGISAGEIVALGERIQRAKGAALHLSVGVNMGPFGTLAYVALQALAYVTGNLDRAGGSVFQPMAVATAHLFRAVGVGAANRRSRVGNFAPMFDQLPGGIMADEILTAGPDRVRALIVIAGDPARSVPDSSRVTEALRALDLLVTLDPFENATGRLAHYLLPATTWLERADLANASAILQHDARVQVSAVAMRPFATSRHEAQVLDDLLARVTKPGRVRISRLLPWLARVPASLRTLPGLRPRPGKYLGRGPLHPGHRVHFWHPLFDTERARLDELAQQLAMDGFVLISRRRRLGHNSWIHGGVRDGNAESSAWMSPGDLRDLGAESGTRVEIRSRTGSITLDAVPVADVRPGTVVVPHGLPDVSVNAVIPSGPGAVEPASGQHWMTGIPVTVRAAG